MVTSEKGSDGTCRGGRGGASKAGETLKSDIDGVGGPTRCDKMGR